MNDNYFKIDQCQTAEIIVPAASTVNRYYFHNLPNLRCKRLMALNTYTFDNIPAAPSQAIVINAAVSNVAFLTLVDEQNRELIKEIPYLELVSTGAVNAATVNRWFHAINDHVIVWEKSYITLGATGGIAPAQDEVFLFNIYFQNPPR